MSTLDCLISAVGAENVDWCHQSRLKYRKDCGKQLAHLMQLYLAGDADLDEDCDAGSDGEDYDGYRTSSSEVCFLIALNAKLPNVRATDACLERQFWCYVTVDLNC